jgi:hypothetical protein
LTLTAARDVNINNAISATNGNLVVCCGRDINDNGAITTTNGSMLLNAGRNVNLSAAGAVTATDGNITICAGTDINVNNAITLTRGSTIPAQSLGLAPGLVMIAGNGASGPGVAGGTVIFAPTAPPVAVTGPNAAAVIDYNPVSYATPTDYSTNFTLTGGATLTEHMLLFPVGDKVDDGTTAATLTGFKSTAESGIPAGVTLVAGAGSTAVYDSAGVGTDIGITYNGYSLAGANAADYALAANCCSSGFRTSGTITAVAVVTPPVDTPPVDTPPVDTPPVDTPPVDTPPVDTPPVDTPPVDTPPTLRPVQMSPVIEFPPEAWSPGFVVVAGGVRMPPPPPPAVLAETYVPPVYVAPVYPRKQDRY